MFFLRIKKKIAAWSSILELLLESLGDMVPYAFAYDNIHCVKYLATLLGEGLQRKDTDAEVFRL